MGSLTIERVLQCPQLPSLPAIAAQVLELTSRQDVPIREIASVVQNDQALAGKILKTVNSSFYGLSSPCPSIDRAMSYLGLNTVKSLVLGFSFVDSHRGLSESYPTQDGFNLTRHWRRAIYGASAARIIAGTTASLDPDEAFLAALLQDVGMLAMFVSLGEEYAQVIESTDGDNECVIETETEAFGLSHDEVGAALVEQWRLPSSIIQTARHHHDPSVVSGVHSNLVRCGGLASLMASAAAQEAGERELTLYLQRARAWFGMERERAELMLQQAVDGAVQLSALFAVETGKKPDLARLLVDANEALVEHQIETQRKADDLARQAFTDGLTGVANRKRFDDLLADGFDQASRTDSAITVFFCDADKFKTLNDTYGHQAGDAVLVELAHRLTDSIGGAGTLCRYGGEEFAAVLPDMTGAQAALVAERCRVAVESSDFDVREVGCGVDMLPVTISVGIASREVGSGGAAKDASYLLRAADKAVYAAKSAGRNCVRLIRLRGESCETPSPSATPQATSKAIPQSATTTKVVESPRGVKPGPLPFRILLVEDDLLQQKMLGTPLSHHADYELDIAGDGASARSFLQQSIQNDATRYGLVLMDIGLPDTSGVELVKQIRKSPTHRTTAVVVLSASEDDDDIRDCLAAGANAYITKQSICDDPKTRILNIVQFWTTTRQAA
ncbi:MAG: HDOD domain-containing protein [Phycisphaerales bacterium JB065]